MASTSASPSTAPASGTAARSANSPRRNGPRVVQADNNLLNACIASMQPKLQLMTFSFQAPAYMDQSPVMTGHIVASAREQIINIAQRVCGIDTDTLIHPNYPQCLFSPPKRKYTQVSIWVAITNTTAAEQIKQHMLQHRYAQIHITAPGLATAVPAQLHVGDEPAYAFKLDSTEFGKMDPQAAVELINSRSPQLGGFTVLWLGHMERNMVKNRYSQSVGQLPDLPMPNWDSNPSPGMIGLAVSGIKALTHTSEGQGVQMQGSAGVQLSMHFRRIANRASILPKSMQSPTYPMPMPPPTQPRTTPMVHNPAPVTTSGPAQAPPALRTAPTSRPPGAAQPTATTPAVSPPNTTPERTRPQPPVTACAIPPFPVGSWVSRLETSTNIPQYGFVLAHIQDRLKNAPKSSPQITFLRVVWADSEYLDYSDWTSFADASTDPRLTNTVKEKVQRNLLRRFNSSTSALGMYVHALTPMQWSKLGATKPTTRVTFAPIGTKRARITLRQRQTLRVSTSQPPSQPPSTEGGSDMQLEDNPSVPLTTHSDDGDVSRQTTSDSEYGYAAEGEGDGSDYDRRKAAQLYETPIGSHACM